VPPRQGRGAIALPIVTPIVPLRVLLIGGPAVDRDGAAVQAGDPMDPAIAIGTKRRRAKGENYSYIPRKNKWAGGWVVS
jgi:hypothetical protein